MKSTLLPKILAAATAVAALLVFLPIAVSNHDLILAKFMP
jgi:hypothetical protein